jgi:DNA polymerase-3 subunit delta
MCLVGLADNYLRQSFSADRYFTFNKLDEIIEANSLFGDKNFIEVVFKTKPTLEQQKQLPPILEKLGEHSFLLLICDKLDKKELAAEWLKTWAKQGEIILLQGDDSEARLWCQQVFSKAGLEIDHEALDLLVEMNQNNLSQLFQESQKLVLLFKSPHKISLDDARNHLIDNAQYNVFALSNAYLNGHLSQVVKIFPNLCSTTEDAILIIWNLAEDLRKLIRIKGALKQTPNFMAAINGLRIWGEGIAAFQRANQRLNYAVLLECLDELAQIDCILKGIKLGDSLVRLEQLLITICKTAQPIAQ